MSDQKKQYVKEYIRSLNAIEEAMEPYNNFKLFDGTDSE